jgi:predicted acetyltransferase
VLARARTLRLPDQTSYISMVYTAPQARRNGYARDLMLALLAADAAAGVHTAVLMSSQMAIPLYQNLGFVPLCNTHIYTI